MGIVLRSSALPIPPDVRYRYRRPRREQRPSLCVFKSTISEVYVLPPPSLSLFSRAPACCDSSNALSRRLPDTCSFFSSLHHCVLARVPTLLPTLSCCWHDLCPQPPSSRRIARAVLHTGLHLIAPLSPPPPTLRRRFFWRADFLWLRGALNARAGPGWVCVCVCVCLCAKLRGFSFVFHSRAAATE